MFFALLVLISAFLIESIGTFVSTVGLASLFAANPVIIVLAIALDLGKVVAVSFLYKHFKKINLMMKTYMTAAVMVLMLITSAGAFGYLSKSFQTAIQGTNQNTIVINSLTDEQIKLQKRKEEIDAQIAKLPDNSIRGRQKLMSSFAPEVEKINSRIAEIDQKLPELKVESIKKNTEVGPIIYVAQAFGTDPEHAVKWVIMIIIFVFDPLAISLLLAGNYLLEERKKIPEIKITNLDMYPDDIDDQASEPWIKTNPVHEEIADKLVADRIANIKSQKIAKEKADVKDTNDYDYGVQPPSPWPREPTAFESFVDSLPKNIEPDEFQLMADYPEGQYGNHRYKEKSVEALDHLTNKDLGNKKPIEINIDPPAEVQNSRETISLNQVMPRPRSQLESINSNGDVTIT